MTAKRKPTKPTDEWGTPQWLFDHLNDEFGFELDVCASKENAKCKYFLTKDEDGLSGKPWERTNWCNPPYSNQLPWVEASVRQVDDLQTTVMLLKHDPSTRHGVLASKEADEIRIITHRIAFEGAPCTANFPSSIAVFRPRLYTRKTDARILYVDYREIMG